MITWKHNMNLNKTKFNVCTFLIFLYPMLNLFTHIYNLKGAKIIQALFWVYLHKLHISHFFTLPLKMVLL